MKNRNLKVCEFVDIISRTKPYRAPRILLQGKWLEEAGFKPGDKITVECSNGKLLIKKAE